MPILEVEIVSDTGIPDFAAVTQAVADAAGDVFDLTCPLCLNEALLRPSWDR
jgi:hypothetical protein